MSYVLIFICGGEPKVHGKLVTDVFQTLQAYFAWTLSNLNPLSVVDILLVAATIYGLLYLIRGTQAVQLLRGFVLLILVIVFVTNILRLTAFSWLIKNSIGALLVAIPVIFQPELRRALERLGRAGRFASLHYSEEVMTVVIRQVTRAVKELAGQRHGALIVLERETGLQDIADTGTALNSAVSTDLLLTIFYPKTPLHDGAVIIHDNLIVAAGAVLPLSDNATPDQHFGTRHLAALGITEQTDAIAIVVSEETGTISVARHGRMVRNVDEGRLNRLLHRSFYKPPQGRLASLFRWRATPRPSADGSLNPETIRLPDKHKA